MTIVKTIQVNEHLDGAMDNRVLGLPEFWGMAWSRDRKASLHVRRKIRNDQESMDFWSQLAPTYGQGPYGKSKERVARVMAILDREKVLEPGAAVLDVGSGPGTFSLPFAERVKTVMALDGASGMCEALKQRAEAKGLMNIKVMKALWKDVALDRNKMTKAFDLVFASMTPAVCDEHTLLKLNRASRKYGCLITSDGGHSGKARDDLWERIFKEKRNGQNSGMIYIFNFLYSMGCRPSLQYMETQWAREETVDQAVERFIRSYWLYTEMTSKIRETIRTFVEERSVNGFFREEIKNRLAVIIWGVNDA